MSAAAEVTRLYGEHRRALTGLACSMLGDWAAAEDVVQDSFVALLLAWADLRDPARAPAWLRATVANRSRSAIRRRAVEDRHLAGGPLTVPAAELEALRLVEHAGLRAALARLPERQRRVIVLRYYGGLPERQVADVMGIRVGTVKAHGFHAVTALRAGLVMSR